MVAVGKICVGRITGVSLGREVAAGGGVNVAVEAGVKLGGGDGGSVGSGVGLVGIMASGSAVGAGLSAWLKLQPANAIANVVIPSSRLDTIARS
jgi:hypothetical protein